MAQWLREFSIGDWYQPVGQADDQPFEIVGVDLKAELVLVQYYDGALDEIDFDSWAELNARPTSAPENPGGALDVEPDDLGMVDDRSGPAESHNAVDWLDAHGL